VRYGAVGETFFSFPDQSHTPTRSRSYCRILQIQGGAIEGASVALRPMCPISRNRIDLGSMLADRRLVGDSNTSRDPMIRSIGTHAFSSVVATPLIINLWFEV
jgi:hypothetical protein